MARVRKAARLEARIDANCTKVGLLAAMATNGWKPGETATSLKACADRLDKLAWRYDRLEAAADDAKPATGWRRSVSAGAREEAVLARGVAEVLDRGDASAVRQLLAAHLQDDDYD